MDEIRFEGRSEVEEVRRRLRLSRLVPGVGSTTAIVEERSVSQIVISLSPPDPGLASQIEALFPDIAVVVRQGIWQRSLAPDQ
ncbi:hypothetical protein ACSMXN_07345 [Jatrophihabitans sp. DSM 45814]